MTFKVLHGDCLERLKELPDNSIDAVVTDPPYGLSFMGKKWDYDVPSVEVWSECLRVLKPGGHLLAFAGTRTQHRMAVRIEDAGFEIRDMIAWVYGSGFPKSLDVSKAIDKRGGNSHLTAQIGAAIKAARLSRGVSIKAADAKYCGGSTLWAWYEGRPAGQQMPTAAIMAAIAADWPELQQYAEAIVEAERDVIGRQAGSLLAVAPGQENDRSATTLDITSPATEAACQWQGWGTALKPSIETITMAIKPCTDIQERDTILSNLIRLEARLWLLSSASAAEKNSTSNQSEYGAACAIAQWSAEEITNTLVALCDQMGTSLFELATNTSLNIVSSWRRTLVESWSDGNTSTIETKSSTTTDLRTLKFSLSQITPESIIKACSLPGGFSVNASTAESHFNASLLLLQSIRTLSATEPAISQEAENCRGADVKPNLDPCIMARKPLIGTVAENVLAHGTGALNIDACRVHSHDLQGYSYTVQRMMPGAGQNATGKTHQDGVEFQGQTKDGRWPANLIHDGSEEVLAGFPDAKGQQGALTGTEPSRKTANAFGEYASRAPSEPRGDAGSAARFFYCAKASKQDRNEGLNTEEQRGNVHPTVKPTDLMRYLCRLVTPPGGTVLDPFNGSGSTGKAAVLEGFSYIGIEREAEYVQIAEARIAYAVNMAQDERQKKSEEEAQGCLFG